MPDMIACIAIGCICIVIGILNTMGNISSLHAYHRKRVREQDIRPFGRTVGAGTILCGTGMTLYGVLGWIAKRADLPLLTVAAAIAAALCLIVGAVLCFYAMFKYNKGIF